jgi:hypothetical protein
MCKENHLQHPSVADLRRGSDLGVAWPARERVRAVVLLGNDTKLRLEQRLLLHLEHLHFHHVDLAFVGVHVGAQFDVMSHVIL